MPKVWIGIAVAILVVSCSSGKIAGGTSDHGNARIAGIVTDSASKPVSGAIIVLRPSDYIFGVSSVAPCSTRSDSKGSWHFDSLDVGTWTVEGHDSLACGFISSVKTEAGTHVDSMKTVVQPLNWTRFVLPTDSRALIGADSILVYIPGSSCHQMVHFTDVAGDTVRIEGIPEGRHAVAFYPPLPSTVELKSIVGFDSLSVDHRQGFDATARPARPNGKENGVWVGDSNDYYTAFPHINEITDASKVEFRFTYGTGDTTAWVADPYSLIIFPDSGSYAVRAQLRYVAASTSTVTSAFLSPWSDSLLVNVRPNDTLAPGGSSH